MKIFDSNGNEVSTNTKRLINIQSPSIAYFAPGQWTSKCHNLNRTKSYWICRSTSIPEIAALLATCQSNEHGNFEVKTSNNSIMEIWYWTPKLQWLDIITIKFVSAENGDENGDINIVAESKSSSICPTSFPGALFFGILFCGIPFLDHGKNREHLDQLKKILSNNRIQVDEMEYIEDDQDIENQEKVSLI